MKNASQIFDELPDGSELAKGGGQDAPSIDWLGIESAPKDGTVIDLFHKSAGRMVDVWWDNNDECWSILLPNEDFTHWMLPPNPPK